MKTDTETVRELFYQQIRDLTQRTLSNSFDIQFSERWIR